MYKELAGIAHAHARFSGITRLLLRPIIICEMAEGGEDLFSMSIQRLDDELTCPVCTEHFKEPKVLPCLHYYCKTCIADLIKRAPNRPFNCPECRREARAESNDPERYILLNKVVGYRASWGEPELSELTELKTIAKTFVR